MAFSSNFFIFAYLPIVLLIYFLSPGAAKNFVLLIASLLFYAFDAGPLIWLLIISILLNHFAGHAIARRSGRARCAVFFAAVAANFGFLLYYKYAIFFWSAVEAISSFAGFHIGKAPVIDLPIGISFFTFQAVSYIADIYTGRIVPASRLIDFGAYHSLFPQLIAGPIVRYIEIERGFVSRSWIAGGVWPTVCSASASDSARNSFSRIRWVRSRTRFLHYQAMS